MLRLASAAEKVARDVLAHSAWGQGLSVEGFVEREAKLRAHPWARQGMRTWLWLEAERVLGSCETFAMRAQFNGASVLVEGVASVFVEPALRGQGHASAMMNALVAQLRSEARAAAVILFSDVGAAIYERSGFRAFERAPVDTVFDVSNSVRPERPSGLDSLREPRVHDGQHDALVLAPTVDQLDWHVERERVYRSVWKRTPLQTRGVLLGESFLQWASFDKTNDLVVLDAFIADPQHVELLINVAKSVAFEAGLERVRVWGDAWRDVPGARVEPRDGELPMVCGLSLNPTAMVVTRGSWV